MKSATVKKMQALANQGYHFVRVSGYYQPEELVPEQMDPRLDTLADTPAYHSQPQLRSNKRQFLLVMSACGDVVVTLWLGGRQAERLLNRKLDQLLS